MQGVYSIPSRLTAGGERGSCRPWFSRDNYCSLVARLRLRFPDTYALLACKLCAPRTMLSLAGRSIRSAHGRADRRSAMSTRFRTDITGGFPPPDLRLPFRPLPLTCRRRRRNKHGCILFNGLRIFFVCRQVRQHRKRQVQSEIKPVLSICETGKEKRKYSIRPEKT